MPEPGRPGVDSGGSNPVSPEEQIREAIERCESGYCSNVDWIMLNKTRDSLVKMKQNDRIKNLIDMIQPILNKYGYHGSSAGDK